jgi:hypothetical protein
MATESTNFQWIQQKTYPRRRVGDPGRSEEHVPPMTSREAG